MSRIEDYALIGDGRSAALVSAHGSLDWLCWPRFDADTCFAALLGGAGDGHWSISPLDDVLHTSRRYRPGTAILETSLETRSGTIVITDLMPWKGAHRCVIRRVACIRGKASLRIELLPRFDYGRALPSVRRHAQRWQMIMGPMALWLDGASDLSYVAADVAITGVLHLEAGERRHFALHCADSWHEGPTPIDAEAVIGDTETFWREWSEQHALDGCYAAPALRSLITLKMLTDRDTGGVVAAPTSSLPECLGGHRNWDYRYGWLRDASFTLLAFAASGFGDDAARWRDWLTRCIGDHPAQLQIMYAIDGRRRLDEWTCQWLSGYEHAMPVRFGNGAAGQRQIDVFGEVIHALYQSRRHGLPPEPAAWELECRMVEHLAVIWHQPGHGIWEMRGEPRVFTLSRAMVWIGIDRALKSALEFDLPAPVARWTELAHTIRQDVLARGVDAARGNFTQVYGGKAVDASLLLLAIYGFLPVDDPRMNATIAAIEEDLFEGGLLLRYRPGEVNDGMESGEGAFLACNFWLVHARILQGRTADARDLMERLLACANDLGLLAEEFDTQASRLCGNFPQAISHVALINAALAFEKSTEGGPVLGA